MMKKTLILLLTFILVLVSCTNNIENPVTLHGDEWVNTFEEFWAVMNDSYVHFTNDSINWDNVYGEYHDKFASLSKAKEWDSFKAFTYFKEIVWSLSDYHYKLVVSDDLGYTLETRPSVLQKWKSSGGDIMDFPDIKKGDDYYTINGGPLSPVDASEKEECWETAVSGYSEIEDLGTNFHSSSLADYQFVYSESGTFTPDAVKETKWNELLSDFDLGGSSWFYGVTNSGVLYIYFSSFVSSGILNFYDYINYYDSFSEEKKKAYDEVFSAVKEDYDYIKSEAEKSGATETDKEKYRVFFIPVRAFDFLNEAVTKNSVKVNGVEKEINGIVLDLRCNGGGSADFLCSVMGTFFSSDRTLGTEYSRMGLSRYEYTPPTVFNLGYYNSALKNKGDYSRRLAVITNGFSASCSEVALLTSKLLSSSKSFGSTTFGATCSLSSREIYQSGPYETDKLTVRTTTNRFTAYDGKSYEGIGVPVDVEVPLSTTQDLRFEKAVKWASSGSLD